MTKLKTSVLEVSQKTNNWSASLSGLGDNHDEQVSAEDVKARNGKARNLIDNLIAAIKEQLAKIDINEVVDALQVYSEKSGKDLTLLIDFIK